MAESAQKINKVFYKNQEFDIYDNVFQAVANTNIPVGTPCSLCIFEIDKKLCFCIADEHVGNNLSDKPEALTISDWLYSATITKRDFKYLDGGVWLTANPKYKYKISCENGYIESFSAKNNIAAKAHASKQLDFGCGTMTLYVYDDDDNEILVGYREFWQQLNHFGWQKWQCNY